MIGRFTTRNRNVCNCTLWKLADCGTELSTDRVDSLAIEYELPTVSVTQPIGNNPVLLQARAIGGVDTEAI